MMMTMHVVCDIRDDYGDHGDRNFDGFDSGDHTVP